MKTSDGPHVKQNKNKTKLIPRQIDYKNAEGHIFTYYVWNTSRSWDTQIKRQRRPCEDPSRDWSDAATSQETSQAKRSGKRQGRIVF